VDHLSSSNFSGDTRPYRPLEDVSKALGAPALSDAGQRRVVWQWFMQRIANEPTNRQVHLCFAHQATVVDNAKQKTGEHQPHRYFGIDPRAAIVGTIEFRDLRPQPTQIEDPIDAYQDVVIREQFSQ
jgi:hypothetical protein